MSLLLLSCSSRFQDTSLETHLSLLATVAVESEIKNISVLENISKISIHRSNQINSTNMWEWNFPIKRERNDSKVYIIGVVHYSMESRRTVKNLIRKVQPHIVVLEECEERVASLF